MRESLNWRRLLTPLRFLISGGLLVYLIWHANPAAIWGVWQSIDLRLLGVALGLQLTGVMISAYKWNVLLGVRDKRQPYPWIFGTYMVGQFANNFLPTMVGGDALRAVQLGRRVGSFSHASASVFFERLTGFLALSLIASVALVLTYFGWFGTHLQTEPLLMWLTAGFAVAAIGAVICSFAAPQLLAVFGSRLPAVARGPLQKVAAALAVYGKDRVALSKVLALSFVFQSIWILMHVACALSLGIAAPLLIYALMVPITDIVGLAPIFVNNLGAREFIFSLYLAQVGVAPATALALSFLVFTTRLSISAIGGLVLLFGGADLRVDQTARRGASPRDGALQLSGLRSED